MFKPVKQLGQNFLLDKNLVRTMVNALDLNDQDEVIEIGPGLGALTIEIAQQLLTKDSKLIAVEIDPRFTDKLKTMFLDRGNIRIIEQDILEFLPQFTSLNNFKLIGSLPYYITSPILYETIKMKELPTLAVLLVQKEVADKVTNTPPDATYISSLVQTFFNVEKLADVDKSKFSPEPKVHGGIIKFTKRDVQLISHEEKRKYEGFLSRAYSNPRKMLNKIFTSVELARANIDGTLRAQNIPYTKWVEYFNILTKN